MKRGSLRIVSNNCILPLGLKMEDQTLMSDKNEETERRYKQRIENFQGIL